MTYCITGILQHFPGNNFVNIILFSYKKIVFYSYKCLNFFFLDNKHYSADILYEFFCMLNNLNKLHLGICIKYLFI